MSALFSSRDHIGVREGEIIVVGFAGGGGSCEGIRMALARDPEEALNHDPEAVAMHRINHPDTHHWCQDIWQAQPSEVAAGRPIGLAWFSPDCKHFSKAKGGRPVEKKIRDLAWVVTDYARLAAHLRPRVIMLENVEEFVTWGPLDSENQPDAARKGETFQWWVAELRRLGYAVEWRELRASQYGAPTIRKRLFVIARCDGLPIIWPAPTHGPGLRPYRTAAEIIDWSIPCNSIFGRQKPLAEATQRRIFNGLKRFVIDHPNPFIVPVTHQGDHRVYDIAEPLRTITTAQRGEFALVTPYVTKYHGESAGAAIYEPLPTLTANSFHKRPGGSPPVALVTAWLAQHNAGPRPGAPGHGCNDPVSTLTATGSQQALVTSHLVKLRNNCDGQDQREPLHTVTTGGHFGEVRAFLVKYYGSADDGQECREPLHTTTTKARFGLVTVAGVDYQIADIGMRMLTPRELFRAQGFPDSYVIDFEFNGRPLPKSSQVRLCGNSVCPNVAAALVSVNVPEMALIRQAAE